MRRIFARPDRSQRGGLDYEEKSSHWFELFLDLVFVGAAANLADTFREDTSWEGLWAFLVLFFIFAQTWRHYVTHVSRYSDTDTLIHSIFLFGFVAGVSLMSVNATGFTYSFQFCAGYIGVELVMVLLGLWVFVWCPRARRFQAIELVGMHTPLMIAAIIAMSLDIGVAYKIFLSFVAIWVDLYRFVWIMVLHLLKWKLKERFPVVIRKFAVPLNIDHIGDRHNDFLMLMLGEAMVSALIDYHSVKSLNNSAQLLGAMGICLLLIFSLGLLIYHLKPTREQHALRRAFITALGFFFFNELLASALLLVSVGVKYVISSVAHGRQMSAASIWVLFSGEAVVFVMLFFLRSMHFYRIENLFNGKYTTGMLIVSHIWWVFAALIPGLPMIAVAILLSIHQMNPFVVVSVAAGISLFVVIVEAALADIISRHNPAKGAEEEKRSSSHAESVSEHSALLIQNGGGAHSR